MKTAELTGAQLDLWVAHAEGMPIYECGADSWPGNGAVHCEAFRRPLITVGLTGAMHIEHMGHSEPYTPSTNWAQGGPIIEREKIGVTFGRVSDQWYAMVQSGGIGPRLSSMSDTPLVAAMRAYVASKFGDEAPAQEPGEQKG
jgi:hypothetical protein